MPTTKTKTKIKTIDISAKEWFDKVNGNSYHSAQVIINYGLNDQRTIYCPLQYGYGDSYKYTTLKALQDAGEMPAQDGLTPPHIAYSDMGIIVRNNKQENCLKRDVIAWGQQ
jgi:hypothetical protein